MSTETIKIIRDREGGGYGGWGRGRLYTYCYTVTTRMTPALRWAATRAIFINCKGQSHKTASTDHNFWRERRAGVDSNRGPSAYQPNILPLGQTSSLAGSPRDLLNILANSNTVTEALTLQPCVHRTIKLQLLLHHSNIQNKKIKAAFSFFMW